MSDPKLDLSAYDAAVVEHGLYGVARTRMFADIASGPWNADLSAGSLTIAGRSFEAQILGTFSAEARTFLWAWANPGASSWGPSLGAAIALRELGKRPGHAVFREKAVAEAWVSPRELAYVAGELAGGHATYFADAGSALAILLVTNAAIDPRQISPAYLPGVLLDFQSFAMVDVRACASRFFERLGFAVEDEATRTLAERSNGERVTVTWDEQGRITNVELTAGRA